jgi:hypothetical protein
MNTEELVDFIKINKCNFTKLLRTHHNKLYTDIDTNYPGKEFSEKLYRYINRETDSIGKCIICKNDCGFIGINRGFNITCSIKCRDVVRFNVTRKTKQCLICNKSFDVYLKDKRRYCSDECRIIQNKLNSEERTAKSYESNLRNHGGVHACSLPEHIIKSKTTMLERYGTENFRNISKSKQTRLERYGDENYSNPEKVKETCLAKYGVKNIFLYKKSNGIGISKPQRKLFEIVKEKYPSAVLEYQIPELNISADIYVPEKNLVIEFFGDYWHCNPAKYPDDYWHKGMKRTAREVRLKDIDRLNKIKSLGYDVQIIWEFDFKSNVYTFPGA